MGVEQIKRTILPNTVRCEGHPPYAPKLPGPTARKPKKPSQQTNKQTADERRQTVGNRIYYQLLTSFVVPRVPGVVSPSRLLTPSPPRCFFVKSSCFVFSFGREEKTWPGVFAKWRPCGRRRRTDAAAPAAQVTAHHVLFFFRGPSHAPEQKTDNPFLHPFYIFFSNLRFSLFVMCSPSADRLFYTSPFPLPASISESCGRLHADSLQVSRDVCVVGEGGLELPSADRIMQGRPR